jgi:hypothetical protein
MQRLMQSVLGAALLSLALAAAAQKPIAYPAKGQSAQKQSKDERECGAWAKQSTGIDPAMAAAPAPQETGAAVGGGERASGAARGALGGAAIGAIAGDTGKGAGIGAVVGTMRGGRQARQNQATRNEQAQAGSQEALGTYYRAFGACMSGRGYTLS